MVQALEILKQYITCEDAAIRNKFFNLLDSFWHKNDGDVLKTHTIDQAGNIAFTFLKSDGSTYKVNLPALPNSKPISFITGLEEALGGLVSKVPGKGLSSNDLTTELLNKLNSLQNYQHPQYHQIGEVEGLPEALEGKANAPAEGYGFSQANYTPDEKEKLASYNLGHYGNPVADLDALAAIPATEYANDQRRYVAAQGCDYFYDADAVAGDLAPADQVEGIGFWMKGVTVNEIIDALTSGASDKALSANQGRLLRELIAQLEEVLDIDENINAVRNITMRNNGEISSGLYFYDNPDTETLYQFIRYNASTNFIEIGSNDGQGEVISAKVDRGKKDWEFQDSIQILKAGRGVRFATPSFTGDGNSNSNKFELRVDDGGVLELYSLDINNLNALIWSSKSSSSAPKPTKIIPNTSQYTAVLEDKDKFLIFTNPINFIIPSGIFSADDEIDARNKANGDVTVVGGSGMTVQVVSSQSKQVPQYGFFGLRFESASVCGLLGQLKPI
jgi:hypothetical protein